jgi:hypothetical protein
MHRRIQELYCWVIPTAISGYTAIDREIIDCFFQLHFMNFEIDFLQCVKHLHTWTKRDFDEFLCDLKKNGPFLYRIPRGFNESTRKNPIRTQSQKNLIPKRKKKKLIRKQNAPHRSILLPYLKCTLYPFSNGCVTMVLSFTYFGEYNASEAGKYCCKLG